MWCPKCRYEYRDGITECADCHIPLVEFDDLPEEKPQEEIIDADFVKWANEHGDQIAQIRNQEEELHALEERLEDLEDVDEILIAAQNAEENRGIIKPYRSKADIANDYKTSGITLLMVGGLGLIAMVLVIAGIIPLYLASNVRFLTYGVMTALFVIFILIGIKSMAGASKYEKEALMEIALTEELKNWFMNSFNAEEIDSDSFSDNFDESEDIEKYYKRIDNIKNKIIGKYTDLDEAYLDKMSDDIYHDIFEPEEG